jgi:uncharacterized membrane protein (DUF485 family)
MEIKKVIGIILQIPIYALVVGSLGASIYAAAYKIQGVTWVTPIILAGFIISFIIGAILRKEKRKFDNYSQKAEYVQSYSPQQ